MRLKFLCRVLENPIIDNIVQRILSIGRGKCYRQTEKIIKKYSKEFTLDVGCGRGRYSHLFKGELVGLDLSHAYLVNANRDGNRYVCASCPFLPFKNNTFYTIFSVGFFHHVNSATVSQTLSEMVRCAQTDFKIIIVEPLFPEHKFDIFGYFAGWLDRGAFYRHPEEFRKLLLSEKSTKIIEEGHIAGSYPYNLRYYVLKNIKKETSDLGKKN